MKKIVQSSIITFCMLLFFVNTAKAQTSFELQCKGYKDGHYVSIKGEEVEKDAKYSYIFSNQTSYKIKVTDAQDNKAKVLVKIFQVGENEEEKEVASNFKNGKYYHTLHYKCGATGRYHIKFEKIAN